MKQIVECVPNFSNGRNPEIYNAIADAIRAVSGVHVLDVSADADHNRTVVTFVGTPEAVVEAAFQGIATAARLINLDEHRGEHPRLGATDVCPLIPIKNISSADCVALAQQLGQRVGSELGITVYLYGDAATRPEREKLSAIRKGEYELWREEIGANPARQPDFGPAVARPWGATTIGVRPFLIAYNIYLNSGDAAVAEKIARAIRFSSGGLRFVQAKGFLVEGQAQVSMNLTNFEKTPIYRVQEMVRREAARYGLSLTKAELVGLTPQKALLEAAKWYLQLDDLQDGQVLEIKLQETAVQETESTPELPVPDAFLEATAAATPTPGGGSTAALAGALAAALAQMVAGLTTGRKKYAAVHDQAQAILENAADLRQQLTAAIAADANAFTQVMAAYRLKEGDEAARATAIQEAMTEAGAVPLQVARLSRAVLTLAEEIAQIGNVNAVTDAAAGGILAEAAIQIAALNVRTNAIHLQDKALTSAWQAELAQLEAEAAQAVAEVQAIAAERGGF